MQGSQFAFCKVCDDEKKKNKMCFVFFYNDDKKCALSLFVVMSKMRFAIFVEMNKMCALLFCGDKKFYVVFFAMIKNSAQNLHFSQIHIFYKFTLF